LFEILEIRGFDPTWRSWVDRPVRGGSVGVNLNDEDSSFFKLAKG
jgi:hypothetical protein